MHTTTTTTTSDNRPLTLQVVVDVTGCRDLADYEDAIQKALNEAGTLATAEVLRRFDTDGQPLDRDGRRYTSKGLITKHYETPYGTAAVPRHVYQHSGGGATYCPLDERAGLVLSATPRFARMIASKFAEFGSARVLLDMDENHGRSFSRGYATRLAEAVALIAESRSDQKIYRLPDFDEPTETLVIAVDEIHTTAFRPEPATVAIASIGFHDRRGERQYVVYLADIIHSGTGDERANRDRFLGRLRKELERARQRLRGGDQLPVDLAALPPGEDRDAQRAGTSTIIGISGGQSCSDALLAEWATVQFIDPARVEERLAEAAAIYFDQAWQPDEEGDDPEHIRDRRRFEQRRWLAGVRHEILSQAGMTRVLDDLKQWVDAMPDNPRRETILNVVSFLSREHEAGRLNYESPLATHAFANAGILADSAREIFGNRIDHPKFKIGLSAARAILILRELTRTEGRWAQFWTAITGMGRVQDRFEPRPRS